MTTPVMKLEEKSVTHAPAANTAATIASEAPNATERILVTSICACLAVLATPPAAPIIVVLRDGATGAGTIIWSSQLMAPVNSSDDLIISGLQIPTTPGNVATLETTTPGGATTSLSVAMTYTRTGLIN